MYIEREATSYGSTYHCTAMLVSPSKSLTRVKNVGHREAYEHALELGGALDHLRRNSRNGLCYRLTDEVEEVEDNVEARAGLIVLGAGVMKLLLQ